ncbi:MAG: hypothetical protein FWH54_00265 [Methanobrevibacter sp.]|nr:hypothetical protein [Methanobrevibacter sp.]
MADRIYIEEETLKFYDNSKILNIVGSKRKEQFLVAMAYGYMGDTSIELKKRKELFLIKDLEPLEISLFRSLAIKNEDVHIISDLDEVFSIAQKYANGGIKLIERLERKCSYEEHMKEFEKKIQQHISSLNID